MMTGQANLPATAQRGAVDGGHHRLAQGFQGAKLGFKAQHHLVEPRSPGLIDLNQFVEVTASEEGLFRRGNNHPGNRVFFRVQSAHGLGHGVTVHRVHGVGGLAGHVDGQDNNLVLTLFIVNGSSHIEDPEKSRGWLNNVR